MFSKSSLLAITANLEWLHTRLDEIEKRLSQSANPTTAVFVGNGRLLVRCRHLNLIYLVEAEDVMISPRFAMNGEYEPEVTEFFLRNVKPGNVCIDVGANFGYYTCMMARLANPGRVLSFEADPQTFEFTRDNKYINWLESTIDCNNQAVSENPGTLTLYRRLKRSGNTSIGRMERHELDQLGESESPAFTVEATTVDEQAARLEKPIDFMKIDVEGAELLVLRGARKTLAANRQIRVVMEWSPGQLERAGFSPADLLDEIASHGLKMRAIRFGAEPQAATRADVMGLRYGNLLLSYD